MKATPRTANKRRINRSNRPEGANPPVPVLFRFPNLASEDAQAPEKVEVAEPVATADSSSPTAKVSDATTSDRIASSQLTTPAATPVPASHTRSTASQPAASSVAASELSHSPQPAASQSMSSTAQRSWWEHWSSGIVLLLLVVAMVSAGVVAFSDDGDEQLALEQDLEEFGIPSLDDIQIDVDSGDLASLPIDTEDLDQETEAAPAPLSPTEAALAGDDSLIPESLELANNSSAAGITPTNEEISSIMVGHPIATGSDLDGALAAEAAELRQAAEQSGPSRGYTLPTVQSSHPSATPGGSPGLYDGAQADPSAGTPTSGLASQQAPSSGPASTGAVYSGVVHNQPPTAAADSENTGLQPLLAPLPTDGSSTVTPNSLAGTQADVPSQTNPTPAHLASTNTSNAPFSSAALTREVDSPTQQSPQNTTTLPSESAANGSQATPQSTASTTVPPAPASKGPVLTATPEMDIDAAIAAWKEYSPNRYRGN